VRRYREAESVPASQIHIPVDTIRIRFDIWRDQDLWWAAADHAGFGLVVEARRIRRKVGRWSGYMTSSRT
jgi:hypothetical protein